MSFAYLNSSLEMVANNSPQLWFVSVSSGIKKSQPWPIYVKGTKIISYPRHCYGYMFCSLQSAPGSMPFFLSRASLLMPKGNSHFGMPSPYLEVRSVNKLLNEILTNEDQELITVPPLISPERRFWNIFLALCVF